MPWLILVLGVVLGSAGGFSIAHGYPYIQMEFGWTQVIAGSVAVSGGVITIAIGTVLLSLGALRGAVERSGIAAPRDLTPALQTRAEEQLHPASPVLPDVRPEISALPPPEPLPSEPRLAPLKPRLSRPMPVERDAAERDAPRPATMEPPRQEPPAMPTIVGRYESSGSSYALFSDGTIEVESAAGKRHFESMDELKIFMGHDGAEPPRAALSS